MHNYYTFSSRLLSFHAVLIEVGYEITTYTTTESVGVVDLSIIIFNPPTYGAPRPFTLSVNTEDGSASIFILSLYAIMHFVTSSHTQLLLVTMEL